MDELKNDRGGTESEPWKYYPGPGDLLSWARVQKAYWEQLEQLLRNAATSATPEGLEAGTWLADNEKYAKLADDTLGFESLSEFGPQSTEEIILQTIESARGARARVELVSDSADIEAPPLDYVGPTDTGGAGKEIRLFVGGAVLAGLAFIAYRASKGKVTI